MPTGIIVILPFAKHIIYKSNSKQIQLGHRKAELFLLISAVMPFMRFAIVISPPAKFHEIAIDKIVIVGYNNCSGCISALNEKLIM